MKTGRGNDVHARGPRVFGMGTRRGVTWGYHLVTFFYCRGLRDGAYVGVSIFDVLRSIFFAVPSGLSAPGTTCQNAARFLRRRSDIGLAGFVKRSG